MAADSIIKEPVGRKGTCRLCFEDGGNLIAPCLCKGSSKWIHRECLNRWRASPANPKSLTNCCECGFQYNLKLERIMNSDAEERQRHVLKVVAAQGIACFTGVQVAIISLGLIIRSIDSKEALVRFFNFPQHPGVDINKPGTFEDALRDHKITYYVCGALAFLCILGIVTSAFWCIYGCADRTSNRRASPGPSGIHCTEMWCPNDFCDHMLCWHGCHNCMGDCGQNCGEFHGSACSNVGECGGGDDCGAAILVLLLVFAIVFIVVGILAAVVATVLAVQKAVQKYAQYQNMRLLAEEYVVMDLAPLEDLGEADKSQQNMTNENTPVLAPRDLSRQDSLQKSINIDIGEIFGGKVAASSPVTPMQYGSTAANQTSHSSQPDAASHV